MKKIGIKKIYLLIIIWLLILILCLSYTFAMLALNTQNQSTSGEGGCFQVSYSATEVNINNLSVTDNYTSGAHSVITLSKDTNCKIYTEANLKLHIDNTSTIPLDSTLSESQAFKYKVLDGQLEVSSGTITRNTNEDFLLATLPITNQEKNYDIYLWIDINQSKGAYDGKTFIGKVYAESAQTSTVNH